MEAGLDILDKACLKFKRCGSEVHHVKESLLSQVAGEPGPSDLVELTCSGRSETSGHETASLDFSNKTDIYVDS